MKNKIIEFEFGEMLTIYRRRAHLTQKDLAKRLKVTPETISNYEATRTFPSYGRILKLKNILGEEFDEVLKIFGETNGRFEGRIY